MDLYREELLDHYKNPRNFGRILSPDKTIHDSNPLCGDLVDLDLKIEDGVIRDVRFSGNGCAISVAFTSMLTERIKGMRIEDVKRTTREDVLGLVRSNLTISRIKCATLGYNALMKLLEEY